MAVGDIISVARYNQMQARASKVLGTGSTTFGYGQAVASSSLPTNVNNSPTVVNSTHMQTLKTDLTKAYAHQNNSIPSLTDIVTSDDITDSVYAEYESIAVDVETNALSYNINQVSTESKLAVTRSSDWGQPGIPVIIHEWEVTFSSADHLRAFFNTGGEVRTRSAISDGTGAKYSSWNSICTTVGVVKFSYTDTVAGSGTDYNIGAYDLTPGGNYVNIWYYEPGAGAYENNNITYQAKMNSASTKITFKVSYTDGEPLDPGDGTSGIDEPVGGNFRSIVEQQRATYSNALSNDYVEVASPVYKNKQTLGA
jgi:hypothetical protein